MRRGGKGVAVIVVVEVAEGVIGGGGVERGGGGEGRTLPYLFLPHLSYLCDGWQVTVDVPSLSGIRGQCR